jgi:predicted nucleotidyltransferase
MGKTKLDLTPEQIAAFRASAQRRLEEQQAEISGLQEQAWNSARHAAQLLRQEFQATRVVAFGSLVHEGCFTRWSDVDIAAWGIAPEDTFKAIGAIMDLDEPFEINLVDVNTCLPSLLEVIREEGVEI